MLDNPQVTDFCNRRMRVAADLLARGYYRARNVLDVWTSQNLAALIPDDPTVTIVDGAATDGRPVITGADIHRVLELLQTYASACEATGNQKLSDVLRVAVNPNPADSPGGF